MANRPTGRQKHVTDDGKGVHRRGEGLGTGPVGNGQRPSGSSSGGMNKAAIGGGLSIPVIIILIIMSFMNGGNGGGTESTYIPETSPVQTQESSAPISGTALQPNNAYAFLTPQVSAPANSSAIDDTVASGARDKRTKIVGGGKDTVTLMVYMCGTDLESKYGMASNDMREMASANYGDNVNIIVYTGGCSGWRTQGISSSVNQIYQIKQGGLINLVKDDGAKAMTSPDTLSGFIRYCDKNFPANRYELILWDHGGGSVSGYGYDEKYKSAGSMRLGDIGKALNDGGVTFDFIGFDACLMATAETALLLDKYADYMIASEETEPGIGWYYTNWLSKLGQDTSMPTLEIGRNIVDDFISTCATQCRGQKTTLSVTDLAEFSHTVPEKLTGFSKSVSELISAEKYQEVSDARYITREFAPSNKIDQVDLSHLAMNVGTTQGKELSDAIRGAVKYNRTSDNMTNAYGISVYFPYKRTSYVDAAVNEYEDIGLPDEYSQCIRQFASLEVCGQASQGGTSSPISSIFGQMLGSGGDTSSLLSSFLGGSGLDMISGLTGSNSSFLSDRALSDEQTDNFISMNHVDESTLSWIQDGSDTKLTLSEEQWKLIHELDMNMFYDDGKGYVDLGLDNTLTFDDNGALVCESDRTWLSVNGQPVAYYHTDTTITPDETIISGYIPAYLNKERVKLIVIFDNETPLGRIAGASYDYHGDGTETAAKSLSELNNGDVIEFLCDFYSYDGEYQDTYYLGEPLTVTDDIRISNTVVGDGNVLITYRFTDIYDHQFWTPTVRK